MTTESNIIEPETNIEPRSPEYLIDNFIPYSEMTDEEIEGIIEYRAAIKARDAEYEMRMAEHNAAMREMIAANAKVAQDCRDSFNALVANIVGAKEV